MTMRSSARHEHDELRQRQTIGIGNNNRSTGYALDDRNDNEGEDDDDEDNDDRARGVSSSDDEDGSRSDHEPAPSHKRHRHRRGRSSTSSSVVAKEIPQDADNAAAQALEQHLNHLPPRWRNWIIRGIFTTLMICAAAWIVRKGPLAMMAITVIVHIFCFKEVIDIGYAVYRTRRLPWFRTLSWYFLLVSSFFIYGASLISGMAAYFRRMHRTGTILSWLVTYHHFISFSLYIIGFVVFVLTLRKGYYFRQFSLFAWTHTVLLILDIAAYSLITNLFEGIIWWVLPCMMIVANDVMAYMFGFFFGKTPLIRLSPKKTWEGFIGGAASTVLIGALLSYALLHYQYFICPVEFDEQTRSFIMKCDPPPAFQLVRYNLTDKVSFMCYPIMLHAVALSLFCSLIGPFGGFCASGFKRAVRVKDFGAVIPGHGGLMDRFDCQVLMAIFVHVYIRTFIRPSSPERIMHQISAMDSSDQVMVYELLGKTLAEQGLISGFESSAAKLGAVGHNLTSV